MTIPNLPTDNLYKFIALTGIFLFLFAIIYPEYRSTEISNEMAIIDGDLSKLEIDEQKIKDKQKEIKKQIDILDKQCNCGSKSIVNDSIIVKTTILDGSNELVELSNSIDKLIFHWKELNRELNLKMIDIITKQTILNKKIEEINKYQDQANTLIPFSIILSFLGFIAWYNRTQKIQDKLLASQYKEYVSHDYCQCCGIYLKHQDFYLMLDKENQQKIKYCPTCYENDVFTEPDLTYNEMRKRVKERCTQLGFSKFETFVYLSRIKKLFRWQKNFKW